MIRCRFKANHDDPRPVKFPPPHPWWCTGYAGDDSYSIVVAYADNEDQIKEYWPEAAELDSEETIAYFFNSRFPKPDWFELQENKNG